MNHEKRSPRPAATGRGHLAQGTAQTNYITDAAGILLERLDGVRETRANQWVARCPAHDDRRPSLSIKCIDDRVLLHCFAGCAVGDVLSRAGLRLADLFVKPSEHFRKPASRYERRRHDQARTALRALREEVFVVYVLAEQMSAGFALDPAERSRLRLAMKRLKTAAEVAA